MSRTTLTISVVFVFLSVGLGLALLWTVMRLSAQSEESNMLGTELAFSQTEIRNLTEQKDTLNAGLTDKTRELDEASLEIANLTTQIGGLEADKAALTDEKMAVESEVKALAVRVDESLRQMGVLTDEISDVEAENIRLENSLAESNQALAGAEGRLTTQSAELSQSRDREIELQTRLDVSQLEIESLQGQLREKEGELAGLESQIETLNKAGESVHGSYGITEDGIFFLDIPLPDFAPLSGRLRLSAEEGARCWISNPNASFLRTPTEPEIDAISWSHRGDRLRVRSEMCVDQADSFLLWIAPGTESQLVLVYWLQQ